HDVIDIDGARIIFPHGWGLVRASNTQDVLVMRFEADTAEHLAEMRRMVEETVTGLKSGL
ncbi:MAG TPA: phosphomannomutase, partial [Acidobacteriota bacterium]|nr:phosphomannomutase [Acidobacteriota bacterium]